MSQAGSLRGSGGGGGTITSVTTSNATPQFVLAGTVENVDFGITNLLIGSPGASISGAFRNASLGHLALRDLVSGDDNSAFGDSTMEQSTTIDQSVALGSSAMQAANGFGEIGIGYRALRFSNGSQNIAIGTQAMSTATVTGSANIGIGQLSLNGVISGSSNIAIGIQSGGLISGASSSNIAIGNLGAAESNTIRIGTQGAGLGQQNRNFQAGIAGVSVSNLNYVTIDTTTGQLGSTAAAGATTYFSAYLSAPTGNVTGDGTLYGPIIFDTTLTNVGAAYNTGTGLFTAPATGVYNFQHTIAFDGGDALTNVYITVWNGSAFGCRSFQLSPVPSLGTQIYSAATTISMTAGDTLGVQVNAAGTNKNVQVYGSVPTGLTVTSLFSGYQVA